jgi:hypothetical protein
MSIKSRLTKLEQRQGINNKRSGPVFMYAPTIQNKEEQLEKWRQQYPGKEPSLIIELVPFGYEELHEH